METEVENTFVPANIAASLIGVPAAWLKREAKTDRLPCLRAGRRILFNIDEVRAKLLERTTAKCEGAPRV